MRGTPPPSRGSPGDTPLPDPILDAHTGGLREPAGRLGATVSRVRAGWGLCGAALHPPLKATPPQFKDFVADAPSRLWVTAWDSRDFAACAGFCNFPLIQADPGEVKRWQDADPLAEALSISPWRPIIARTVHATQVGANVVNVALELTLCDGERQEQAVFLLTHHDGRWGIRGPRRDPGRVRSPDRTRQSPHQAPRCLGGRRRGCSAPRLHSVRRTRRPERRAEGGRQWRTLALNDVQSARASCYSPELTGRAAVASSTWSRRALTCRWMRSLRIAGVMIHRRDQ